MVETQTDRIENMLKILIKANTTIQLTGNNADEISLKSTVGAHTIAPVGV